MHETNETKLGVSAVNQDHEEKKPYIVHLVTREEESNNEKNDNDYASVKT